MGMNHFSGDSSEDSGDVCSVGITVSLEFSWRATVFNCCASGNLSTKVFEFLDFSSRRRILRAFCSLFSNPIFTERGRHEGEEQSDEKWFVCSKLWRSELPFVDLSMSAEGMLSAKMTDAEAKIKTNFPSILDLDFSLIWTSLLSFHSLSTFYISRVPWVVDVHHGPCLWYD